MSKTRPCVAFILLLWSAFAACAAQPRAVPTAGWLERARLSPGDVVLEAKLDTGARTSSLEARNLRQFERDGKSWVAFDVVGNDGRSVRIERSLIRVARIRSALGVDEGRPTVALGLCIGNVYRVTEVNLADRSSLTTPLLIGRRFLEGRLLVDASRSHVLEPGCKQEAAP